MLPSIGLSPQPSSKVIFKLFLELYVDHAFTTTEIMLRQNICDETLFQNGLQPLFIDTVR